MAIFEFRATNLLQASCMDDAKVKLMYGIYVCVYIYAYICIFISNVFFMCFACYPLYRPSLMTCIVYQCCHWFNKHSLSDELLVNSFVETYVTLCWKQCLTYGLSMMIRFCHNDHISIITHLNVVVSSSIYTILYSNHQ